MDSRDGTCGTRIIEWTKKKPTKFGWYWTRGTTRTPDGPKAWHEIVFVTPPSPSGGIYVQYSGTDEDARLEDAGANRVGGIEWHGPIHPPS